MFYIKVSSRPLNLRVESAKSASTRNFTRNFVENIECAVAWSSSYMDVGNII